jgi:plastocyanin
LTTAVPGGKVALLAVTLIPEIHTGKNDAMRFAIIALAASLALSACSGDGSGLPPPGVATTITSVVGIQQTVVGHPVASNPAVKVTDGLGDPVADVSVTFSVTSGGGSAEGTGQTTDATGVATVGQWTVGTAIGPNTLSATSGGLAGSPVEFTATAVAGPAVAFSKNAGDNQAASVGSAVGPVPVSVLVSDAYGNPVVGVPVTFVVASGGGSVTGGQQMTGVDGIATVGRWKLGTTLGPNTLTAAATGLSGPPLVFAATATPIPTAVTVELYSNFFRSLRNGSGGQGILFTERAVDTVAVGGTVTWVWVAQGHNVTPYRNSAFTPSGTHEAGFTFGPITFNTRGEYTYSCTNHSQVNAIFGLIGMTGAMVVR